jgi:hypothetical protein
MVIEYLSNTVSHLDPLDIFRTPSLTVMEYTFFSSLHETFIKGYHLLDHKIKANTFKRI